MIYVRPNDQIGWCPNCREVQSGMFAVYRLAPLFGYRAWLCRNVNRGKQSPCRNSVWHAVMVKINPCDRCRQHVETLSVHRARISRAELDALCNAGDGRSPCPERVPDALA